MTLQKELREQLIIDAKARCKEMGVLASHPHLPALYAQYELDNIMKQVKSLFCLRGSKGVTWNQLANVHNKVTECDGGTLINDAKKAVDARTEELATTCNNLQVKGLSKQRKDLLEKRRVYRGERLKKAVIHLKKCESKQKFVDSIKRKAGI